MVGVAALVFLLDFFSSEGVAAPAAIITVLAPRMMANVQIRQDKQEKMLAAKVLARSEKLDSDAKSENSFGQSGDVLSDKHEKHDSSTRNIENTNPLEETLLNRDDKGELIDRKSIFVVKAVLLRLLLAYHAVVQ